MKIFKLHLFSLNCSVLNEIMFKIKHNIVIFGESLVIIDKLGNMKI